MMNHGENRITTIFETASVKVVNAPCKREMDGGKMGYEHPFTSAFVCCCCLFITIAVINIYIKWNF